MNYHQKQPNKFSRLESLISEEKVEIIKSKTILVIGIGGVGGYVVESLIRSGISKIIIVDHDKIDITNINRQIIALNSTIGKSKVDVMEERIKDINDNVEVIKYKLFFDEKTKEIILDNDIDYVIDCCDSFNSKIFIMEESIKRKIKFISCMGTANKLDPSKLEIVDIRKTYNDPLAKKYRKYINDNNINKKIMVLSSTELPKKNGNILGSSSFVPSSAGLLIASYVIRQIIK